MRRRELKTAGLAVAAAFALALAEGDSATAPLGWQPVGDRAHVRIVEGNVTLDAPEVVTSGAVSRPFSVPAGIDAVLMEAQVAGSPGRGVTFAVHDAATGNTLGYWQNPVPIAEPTEIAAVLPLTTHADRLRLFVGTHDRPSTAEICNLRWTPVTRGMSYDRSVYGVRIDADNTPRQTFKAEGAAMAAVEILVRQLKAAVGGPDLRARLYAWETDLATSLKGPVLAETIVPRRLLPGDAGHGGDEMIVTYGADEVVIAIPLAAPMTPGKTYFVEFTVDGPCGPSQGFISYGWVDGYSDGQLYKNHAAQDWDMWMNVYHAKR